MRNRQKWGLLLVILILVGGYYLLQRGNYPANNPKGNETENPENHKDRPYNLQNNTEIIANMSLSEKIGQMIFAGISGTTPNKETQSIIHELKVGGIIVNGKNIETPTQLVHYMNQVKLENEENLLPLFFGIDQEGGRIAKLPGELLDLPTNAEIGMLNDVEFSYEIGKLLGKQVKAFGFNMNFAPVLDVNSNPNNPVIGDRSFSNHPDVVSQLGIATMKGIQSENIMTTIKHFPGHGDTSVDSHLELPTVDKTLAELEALEFIPFEGAIREGADIVMVGHILLPKIDPVYPSSMSSTIIIDILKEQLGFNGVVITDDMTMKGITNHYEIGLAAVESVKAGVDIVMVAHEYENIVAVVQALIDAVEKGEISEERIDESVERILELKKKYKLKDELVEVVNVEELNRLVREIMER